MFMSAPVISQFWQFYERVTVQRFAAIKATNHESTPMNANASLPFIHVNWRLKKSLRAWIFSALPCFGAALEIDCARRAKNMTQFFNKWKRKTTFLFHRP